MVEQCVFCKISKGEVSSERIYENDNFFSIYDINPNVKGHALVISKKHFETTLDLPSTIGVDLLDCIKKTTFKLMKENNSEGFNLHANGFKIAGQLVPHFHIHILPRKKDDGFVPCA
ncbi:HIT domain-containing protein [Candidatus Pacearchaeota archaeon]|nr:HIT domain-containing protein [Candidatus Pacearchaeota archaeon]